MADLTTVQIPSWLWTVIGIVAALVPPGLVSLAVWTVVTLHSQDLRLTALETNTANRDAMLLEIKSELRAVNMNLLTLQREFDRKFGAAK